MSDENQPDSGSTIAFDTRYDVSTQVDSSAPADKFPAICGSATFAMDVSSTSMNVASVTVTAITQGLIVPSGILSLVRILSRIASNLWPCAVSTYYRSNPYPYSTLIRNHRRIHVHPRPQDGLLRRNRVQHDLHGDPLHDFHVISRRVLRRQQAQHGTRCPRNRIHSSAESLSVRIHLDFCFLPGLHVPDRKSTRLN